jgi:hypothetical protein
MAISMHDAETRANHDWFYALPAFHAPPGADVFRDGKRRARIRIPLHPVIFSCVDGRAQLADP